MHDILGHNLSVMVTLADGAPRWPPSATSVGTEALRILGDTGRQAMGELRRVLGVLREEGRDPRAAQPAAGHRRSGRAAVHGSGRRACPWPTAPSATSRTWATAYSSTVYRIVQESLTNTLKHAGTDAAAEVTWTPRRAGAHPRRRHRQRRAAATEPAAGTGHGLAGIRDRATLYSGSVSSDPRAAGPAGSWTYSTRRPRKRSRAVTTVLIADDQPLQRLGFRMLLEGTPGHEPVGEAANGAEAVRMAAQLRPDVVLMDIRMPGMDGIEATRRIVAGGGRTRVLIVTTFDLDEYAHDGLRAGASGFLLKDARPEELVAGIRAVATRRRRRRPGPDPPPARRLRPPGARARAGEAAERPPARRAQRPRTGGPGRHRPGLDEHARSPSGSSSPSPR